MSTSHDNPEIAKLWRNAWVSTVVWIVSGVVAFSGNFLPDEWLNIPAAGLFVFALLWWPAHRFRARYSHAVRRRETKPIQLEKLAAFERPPVLYLRSFDDDERAARIKGQLTEEEHLGKALSQVGPFLAVGRPGESIPTLGASRVYLGDEAWQSTVEDLIRAARLVILRTGKTAGLHWEVERALQLLTPERLVLLVDNARELRAMLGYIRNVHPHVPPRLRVGWRSIGSIKGFVMFDAEWRPSIARARGKGLYFFRMDADGVTHTTKRLARTLRPVFQSLGMRWQPPPLNWPLIILSGITVAIFAASIVLTMLGM
jgi:hypothetical protein